MNEEEYEECFERLDKYVFGRDMAVKEDWYDLLNYHQQQLNQLQNKLNDLVESHFDCFNKLEDAQDKEDKLRERIEHSGSWNYNNTIEYDLLQILNEGE